jgi:hypothetical protein
LCACSKTHGDWVPWKTREGAGNQSRQFQVGWLLAPPCHENFRTGLQSLNMDSIFWSPRAFDAFEMESRRRHVLIGMVVKDRCPSLSHRERQYKRLLIDLRDTSPCCCCHNQSTIASISSGLELSILRVGLSSNFCQG